MVDIGGLLARSASDHWATRDSFASFCVKRVKEGLPPLLKHFDLSFCLGIGKSIPGLTKCREGKNAFVYQRLMLVM